VTPGQTYWRCIVPARRLPAKVLAFQRDDVQDTDPVSFPRQEGTAVWCYITHLPKGILMAAMQEQGIRCLVEVDDNYIVGAPHGLSKWTREMYDEHVKYVKFSDGVIVSTENLAGWYSKLNKNVWVCPNSVEPSDWPVPEKKDDGVLRIGWAASHSHIADAPLVRRALRWAAEQKDVEVWVYGIGDAVKFPGRVRKVKWTDNLADYRKSLSLCDVHICPLVPNAWADGKSDVKALEACMAGAWPIVSSAEPYKPWHDRTMVATTAKDWETALRWVVRNREKVPQLAAEARDYVLSERTIEKNVGAWKEAVCG